MYSLGGLFKDATMYAAIQTATVKDQYRHCFDENIVWWDWCSLKTGLSKQGLLRPILFCIQGSCDFGNIAIGSIREVFSFAQISCIFVLDLMGKQHVPGAPHFLHINNDKFSIPILSKQGFKSRTINHAVCGGSTVDKRRLIVLKMVQI